VRKHKKRRGRRNRSKLNGSRGHGEAENTTPPSSSPLQNQVCSLSFSVPAI